MVRAPQDPNVAMSVVGTDAVALATSNVTHEPLADRMMRVRFDVAIQNTLSSVILTTPTTPAPPGGAEGLVLWPFAATATDDPKKIVVPSADWDGAPHSFFKTVTCRTVPSSDCFPWERFAAPLAPGATSEARTVGFEMDARVTEFEVVMLLAADLVDIEPPPAEPLIQLSSTSATFSLSGGEVSPAAVGIQVSNGGTGPLTGLTATANDSWLSATLTGTSAPSALMLNAFTMVLPDGEYHATVTVAAPGVSNSPQTIAVTLIVSQSAIASSAIYVSATDPEARDNTACGLGPSFMGPGHIPCRSITWGLERALQLGRTEVRVADARYSEAVTLRNGKHLLGGYRPDTWQRHLESSATIIDGVSFTGSHARTVVALGINASTIVEGFIIHGADNDLPSGNSYGIYVAGSSALVIRNNVIYGGTGGAGVHGSPGANGMQGVGGTGRLSQPSFYDSRLAISEGPCVAENARMPINGGQASAGSDNISGGNGGGSACTPLLGSRTSGRMGTGGQEGDAPGGGAGGAPGLAGFDARLTLVSGGQACVISGSLSTLRGADGGHGGPGAFGIGGQGGFSAIGSTSLATQHWSGTSGVPGSAGGNGGGGGGGGAGGGAECLNCLDGHHRLGGLGGGAGSGGAGGQAGTGGSAGGGSFGIFVVGPAPAIVGNLIQAGRGGAGGAGGSGGGGGAGGIGAPGGEVAVDCTGAGGRGGNGSSGGHGAGGGGGSGGVSVGIYTFNSGTPGYCQSFINTVTSASGGPGGAGGASPGNPGSPGLAGSPSACQSQSP